MKLILLLAISIALASCSTTGPDATTNARNAATNAKLNTAGTGIVSVLTEFFKPSAPAPVPIAPTSP